MGGLLIRNVFSGNENLSLHGIFLVILHADKLPPHIGLCVHKQFHSLKVSGAEIHSEEILLRSIQLKKIPSLFVRLDTPDSDEDILLMSRNIFKAFSSLNENTSCLDPIIEWTRNVYLIHSSGVSSIHDLFPLLEEKGVVKEAYAYNLPITLDNAYEIGYYGRDEIRARINQLSV